MMLANKPHRLLQLLTRRLSLTQGWAIFRGLAHFGIRIRGAKTLEIQAPNMKSSFYQVVAPGKTIETMSDGQSGWKSSAVNEKDNSRFTRNSDEGRLVAQKQF